MQILQVLRLYVWLQVVCTFQTLAEPQQQVLRPPVRPQARLRNATLEDVDNILTTIVAAFSPLPDWKYIYQYDKEFPEEHKSCGREQIRWALARESVLIQVIEPLADSDLAVAAVAVWEQQKDSQAFWSFYSSFSKCMHRDMNITRAVDYDHKFHTLKHQHVDVPFGATQLYLNTLGTHPAYQGRGAGTQLLIAGLERANNQPFNVTLIAQPTAESFYIRSGFVPIQQIVVTSVDGDEEFPYVVMARTVSVGPK